MKKCPYWAEEIQDEVIVCRYCGRELVYQVKPEEELTAKKKLYYIKQWLFSNLRIGS